MPGITTHPVEPWVFRAIAEGVNAVCLFDEAVGSPERTRATVQQLHAASPTVLISVDEEGGEVTRLQSRTGSSFLSPTALGVIADVEVTRASGRLIGDMLGAAGIDWTLAPVADVQVDPLNSVIGLRSFGGHPDAVAEHVGAFIEGIQSTGVIATAKHFPGHGDTHVDSHESLPTVSASLDTLHRRELLAFRSAIGAGVGCVMTGHLLVTDIDADSAASSSWATTTGLLRGVLNFEGVVVTDALDMGAIPGPFVQQAPHAAVACLRAGADVVCLGTVDQEASTATAANAIFQALAEGTLDPAMLVAAAERRAHLLTRQHENYSYADAQRDMKVVAESADRSLLAHGDVALTRTKVDVMRIDVSRTSTIGETSRSVGHHLVGMGLDVRFVDRVTAVSDRDLVIEVRDAWRSDELLQRISDAARVRPDAVIVDIGVPTPGPLPCRGHLTTHGFGNLALALAACRLTERDPRPFILCILGEARA